MSDAKPTSAPGRADKGTRRRRLPFTQVAFAGHNRPEDLGDPTEVADGLKAAFAMLGRAGLHEAPLVTGLARGADLLAAEAWRAAKLGPCRGLRSSTWLNGRETEGHGRNAHLAQTRWLVGAADLLVVLWTGEHARGAGGTADAVRLALEHNIPVLWIRPGEPNALRLIRPEHLDEDFGFLEFLEELRFSRPPLVRKATPAAIHAALGRRHQRWGDLRQRAEDLRLERVAWALGVNTIRHGADVGAGRAVRQIRRLAGLPNGAFDARRVKAWGDWAVDELIVGQAVYHRARRPRHLEAISAASKRCRPPRGAIRTSPWVPYC